MSLCDRAHVTSQLTLIETMHLSSTIFELSRIICGKSPIFPRAFGASVRGEEVSPFELGQDLMHQKATRVPRLSCGVVCVILRLAVSVEHRLVTDRLTHDCGIYCTIIRQFSIVYMYSILTETS